MDSGRPWREWVLAGVVGVSSLTVLFEPRDRAHPLIGVLEGLLILLLAVAAALLVGDETQRGNGVLLCVVGLCLAVEHLHLIDNSPFPMLGWQAGPLAAVSVAVVLVRFPASEFTARGRRFARIVVVVLVALRLTVAVPPKDLRLGWWPVPPVPAEVAARGLELCNAYLLALAVWFIVLMVWRVRNSKGLSRHELAPVVFASLGAALTIMAHVASVFTGDNQVGLAVLVAEQLGLLVVPAGFIFAALQMRVDRGRVSELLMQIRSSSTPGEIESSLAQTLADPSLSLFTWAADEGQWTSADGRHGEPPGGDGRLAVPVDDEDGSPLAVIVTDASVARHGHLVSASAAAVRLALQNAAALDLLRRSRARLAEASLDERKKIERDLHDGVQQRLLALGMSMDRVVRSAPDEGTRELATAAAEQVQEAISELRDLARGILPAVLTQSGLAAAVESAVERLPLVVDTSIPVRRWPMATEATAYFVVCEGLNNVVKHAQSDRAEVEVRDEAGALRIAVRDFGRGGVDEPGGSGLLGLRDRVTALGGSFDVVSQEGVGTCLTAVLPYA